MINHKLDMFGFSAVPFANRAENPFLDASRERLVKTIAHFINYRGFAVLTGAPGTGKTMFLNYISQQLQPNEHKIIYIPFAMLKPADMLKYICIKLNIEPVVSTTKMLGKIQDCIAEIQPTNPILILDEVQKISHQTLETIRLMTNFNFEDKNLFSVIMAGNDEFLQQLKLRINEPIRQRITIFSRLTALSRADTAKYIDHHLKTAGAHQQIIDSQATTLVYDFTSGIPRLINSLMFAALNIAAEANSPIIELEHLNHAGELTTIPQMEVFQ
ncbi:MAG: AAA family ATPase [Victivallaceae bacterium]|nr:AAA family ATPase [Victivallaceae bacterium]